MGNPQKSIIEKLVKIQADLSAAQRLIFEGEDEAALRAISRSVTSLNKLRIVVKERVKNWDDPSQENSE